LHEKVQGWTVGGVRIKVKIPTLSHKTRQGAGYPHDLKLKDALMFVDFENEIDLGAVVELAYGFCFALMAVELGIDFVVDGAGKRGKAVSAVLANDVGLNGSGAGVGHIDDGIRNGIVVTVEHLAEQQLADSLLALLVGRGAERSAKGDENQTANRSSLYH